MVENNLANIGLVMKLALPISPSPGRDWRTLSYVCNEGRLASFI